MHEVRFNPVFKEANESRHRYRVLLGSAGSGKSVNVAQDLILKLSQPQYAGCSLLVVRGVEISHYNSTFAELTAAIRRMGLQAVWDIRTAPLRLTNTQTGNSVIFRGCHDSKSVERLKSITVPNGKVVWAWCEEATELKASDFDIIDDRLRGQLSPGHFFQVTLSFNPVNASHWIKSQLWDYESPDIFRHKSTYLDNIFIDPDYKDRMDRRKHIDPVGYQIYALGEWGETDGLVFPNVEVGQYDPSTFEVKTLGTDFGFNHPHVTLLVGWRDSEPYVLQEVYLKGRTTSEIIEECETQSIPRDLTMYCDSAEPDRIREFQQAGFNAIPVRKGKNSVRDTINWLKNRRIYVNGQCIHTIKELQAYRYRKDRLTGRFTDEPMTIDDDCIAALRYSSEPQRAIPIMIMSKEDFGLW